MGESRNDNESALTSQRMLLYHISNWDDAIGGGKKDKGSTFCTPRLRNVFDRVVRINIEHGSSHIEKFNGGITKLVRKEKR